MNYYILKILLFFFLTSHGLFAQTGGNYFSALNSINEDSIFSHLKFLAGDELQGRGLGSKGIEFAANYIANKFESYGLEKPTGTKNYFQEIPFVSSNPLPNSELKIYNENNVVLLKPEEDYFLYKSGQQTFLPTPVELVFVGYGIVAPEFDYNDYQSVDVEGKVVVYLDSEPQSDDPDYFNGEQLTSYSFAEVKRQLALSRGAAGTIIIPFERIPDWESVRKNFAIENFSLAYDVVSNLSIILNQNVIDMIFNGSGHSFVDIIQMHNSHKMKSFSLTSKISFKGFFREKTFIGRNVIGVIHGSDPELKDSYLLISAHYDHIGIGPAINSDSIYNGALDNAIGVAVLIELSRVFAQLEPKPKRTIVFIALTGEENGLLGSIYYTDNPIFPLYKTIANVNIDGIAFFRDFESVVGIGSEYSSLKENLLETAERFKLTIEEIPEEFNVMDSFSNSDQYSFASSGIPSILILEGSKNKTKSREEVVNAFVEYFQFRYHTPFDDLNQFIDLRAAVKHAKVIFDFCFYLAESIKEPKWNSDSPFLKARLRSIAEKR